MRFLAKACFLQHPNTGSIVWVYNGFQRMKTLCESITAYQLYSRSSQAFARMLRCYHVAYFGAAVCRSQIEQQNMADKRGAVRKLQRPMQCTPRYGIFLPLLQQCFGIG